MDISLEQYAELLRIAAYIQLAGCIVLVVTVALHLMTGKKKTRRSAEGGPEAGARRQ